MQLPDALAWLDRHLNREATAGRVEGLSLEPMQALTAVLGDPQRAYPVIHVTGTNGKGSVARMIEALLSEHGLVVGTYTSPHLARVNERLRRAGEPISDAELAGVLSELADLSASGFPPLATVQPSWFELLTAAAVSWFATTAVDVAVVEVGLLGRYDATNIVEADVAVVTNVGRDHTDGGGDWRSEVAWEKAGIITPGSTLVLGETDPALRPVFDAEGPGRILVREQDFGVAEDRHAVGGHVVELWTPGGFVHDVALGLHGTHQADNAALALAATEAFFDRPLDGEVVRAAMASLRLAGRFEVVQRNPLLVLDGAHNLPAAAAAARTLREEFAVQSRRILVVGTLQGREPRELLEALDARSAALVIACDAPSPRRVPAEEIAAAADALGVACEIEPEVDAAVDRALVEAEPPDAILVTGSLYVVGAARASLGLDESPGADRAPRREQ